MSSKKVTDLTATEARRFFLKDRSYVNFDIPPYFHFDQLLAFTSAAISSKQLGDICAKQANNKPLWPKAYEGVNCTVLSNKDGAYSWRPMQLIHPILYVDLVNTITKDDAWNKIVARFKQFSDSSVDCISIPRESLSTESDAASQVANWWENIEQQSLKQSLRYDYVFSTDITDCYGSIYTHSIEWALHEGGKDGVKAERSSGSDSSGLGSQIDNKLMGMNYGQTNGIPQGSVLMDFIAEIILGYADIELTARLKELGYEGDDYFILRYRDDYRIFTDSPPVGHEILKQLNVVLYELGLKMHPGKTTESNDIILSSLKPEKVEAIYTAPIKQYFQKEALRIYQLNKKYPGAGLVLRELGNFYDRLDRMKVLKNVDYEVLIAIFTMISVTSPKTIHWTAAINSKIIERIKSKSKRKELTMLIINKFTKIPNVGIVDLWLQRIAAPQNVNITFHDNLTKAALSEIKNSELWNSEWLDDDIKLVMDSADISTLADELKSQSISPTIERAEVELFRVRYPW